MIGAIIGDIAGSRFEFNNYRSKDFELFGGEKGLRFVGRYDECKFTDDTVMTCAVAQALLIMKYCGMRRIPTPEEGEERAKWAAEFKKQLIRTMKELAQRYPHAGYGSKFFYWVLGNDKEPYNSYGNGSAMRVSPVIWFANNIYDVVDLATWSAEITHNHPEGIKGAVVTATAGYMAKTGANKECIKRYVQKQYPGSCKETWEEIAMWQEHIETCMNALPVAMSAFVEGESYEDVIKTAIACGGDTDTIAAIAGAVAEPFYGVPEEIKREGLVRLPPDLRRITIEFYKEIVLSEEKAA